MFMYCIKLKVFNLNTSEVKTYFVLLFITPTKSVSSSRHPGLWVQISNVNRVCILPCCNATIKPLLIRNTEYYMRMDMGYIFQYSLKIPRRDRRAGLYADSFVQVSPS